ncbi:putative EG45-like domain containing protein 1 [Oryza glaberrima]|nr:putative EG45-like domain containing protein 1 [Oryza glaberrima]
MAISRRSSMLLVMALVLGTVSLATAASGVATFYTQYTPSACYGNRNMGNMVAAANDRLYNNGAVCGRCYAVKCAGAAAGGGGGNPCTGASVTVKMVDNCASSDGCTSTIDLSREAFAKIANLDAGVIRITYNPTGCP